jgi:tRNA A37 methylthiotransferase MiaB
MNKIKSLDDLKRVREEALEKRSKTTVTGKAHIIVGMGTCGIAAGARETMKAVLDTIEAEKMEGILVTQTGCIGLCEQEPILYRLSVVTKSRSLRKSESGCCQTDS